MEIFTGLASIFSGIFGSIVTSIVTYKMKKLELEKTKIEHEYEIEKIKAETESMIKEAEINLKVQKTISEAELEKMDAQAFVVSQKDQEKFLVKSSYLNTMLNGGILSKSVGLFLVFVFGLIDIIKASIRPFITIYLGIIVTWFSVKLYYLGGGIGTIFKPEMVTETFILIVKSLLQMLFVVWGWWFADRRIAKNINKYIFKE